MVYSNLKRYWTVPEIAKTTDTEASQVRSLARKLSIALSGVRGADSKINRRDTQKLLIALPLRKQGYLTTKGIKHYLKFHDLPLPGQRNRRT